MTGDHNEPSRRVLADQLKFLNERMKDTAGTANQFLGKFVFGGMLAVVALLNVDLVLTGEVGPPDVDTWPILVGVSALVVVIGWLYFSFVANHYSGFRRSHRKIKYKYELTVHAMLTNADPAIYARMLESSLEGQVRDDFLDEFPQSASGANDCPRVADYLLNHHRKRFAELDHSGRPYTMIAMSLVLLTLAARILALVLPRAG